MNLTKLEHWSRLLELALKRPLSDDFILEASQQLTAEGVPVSLNEPVNRRFDDAEVDDLLLIASQALESATRPNLEQARIVFHPL